MVERKENQEVEPSRPKTINSLAELKLTSLLLEHLILNSKTDFPEFVEDYPFDPEIWEAVQFMNAEIKKLERRGVAFSEKCYEQSEIINRIVEQREQLSVNELQERLSSLAPLITRIHARLRAQKWFGNRKKKTLP